MKRLEELDFFRGIAILMVIFCHNLQFGYNADLPQFLQNAFEAGKYGVQLFYIISGFTIFYSLSNYHSKVDTGSAKWQFWIRRFFRIAPMYYLAIIIYTVISKNYVWSGIVLNFTFLHGFSPAYINSIVPGGWSIGIEMLFYLFCPFLFRYIQNINQAVSFLSLTLIVSFVVRYFLIKFPLSTDTSNWASFMYFFLPNQLPVFALGIILFWAVCSKAVLNFKRIIQVTLLILLGIFTGFSIFPEHMQVSLFLALVVYGLFQLQVANLRHNFFLSLFIHIGKISFSLYLVHYALLYLLQATGVVEQIDTTLLFIHPLVAYMVRISLVFLLAIPSAQFFYQQVEMRGMALGKRIVTQQ